jgi:hypothetical protein
MPGVDKQNVEVTVENDVLNVSGRIDFAKYEVLQPVYTEYNVGHYARSFQLSSKVDQGKITADLKDAVITLTLPKAKKQSSARSQWGDLGQRRVVPLASLSQAESCLGSGSIRIPTHIASCTSLRVRRRKE